jgi:hypothetical protein
MGSKKSSTTNSTKLPEFVTNASQQATNLGMAAADRPYTPYNANRFANLSGNEQRAINLASQGNGRAQQYIDQGTKLLGTAKNWDQATDTERKAYEEPVFDAITKPAIAQANKSYDAKRTNLTANQGMLSAKGQDQFNLRGKALDQGINQTTGDITSTGRHQAYQVAQQQWAQDQDMKMRTADALRAVGGDITRMNSQQIQDLLMTGGAERALGQANLDFDYGQFVENRDWNVNNLKPLLAALQGTQGAYDQAGTGKSKESGGALGSIIGLGTSLAGMYFGGGFGGVAGGLGGAATAAGTAMSDFARSPNFINPMLGMPASGQMVG